MPILPPRPYRLASKFVVRRVLGALGLTVAGLACLVGGLWWQGGELRQIARDVALYERGQRAPGVQVSGKETSHNFLLNSYDLDVEFADASGQPRKGKVKFDLLFSSVENHAPADLRYDPADPQRYVLSWAVEHKGARYASSIFMLFMFSGVFGLGMLFVAARTVRQLGDLRVIAERSEELALPVVGVKPVVVNGQHTATEYTIRHRPTPNGPEQDVKQPLVAKEAPLFADAGRTHVVVLVSAHCPERPWIVRESLYPFELSPDAVAEIREKARGQAA